MYEWKLTDDYPKYRHPTGSLQLPDVGWSRYTTIATFLMQLMITGGFVGSTGGKDGF